MANCSICIVYWPVILIDQDITTCGIDVLCVHTGAVSSDADHQKFVTRRQIKCSDKGDLTPSAAVGPDLCQVNPFSDNGRM